MSGSEFAARVSRWSRIRERRDGRDGGGRDESKLRRDSSGVEDVDEDATGRSDHQWILIDIHRRLHTRMSEIGIECRSTCPSRSQSFPQRRIEDIFCPQPQKVHPMLLRYPSHPFRPILSPIEYPTKLDVNDCALIPQRLLDALRLVEFSSILPPDVIVCWTRHDVQ